MRRTHVILAALAAAGASVPLHAQQRGAPVLRLDRPEVEIAEPFTTITGVRELGDGRVIVTDRQEKAVRLVDPRSGAVRQIGKEGNGPNEYGMPNGAWALPGDSTLVYDMANQRFLTFAPDGTPARTWALGGGDDPMQRLLGLPRGVDGSGRLYFAGRPFAMGPNGPQTLDSVPIMRFTPARAPNTRDMLSQREGTVTLAGSVDTVLWVKAPRAQVSGGQSGGQTRVMMTMGAGPFDAQDEWTVGLDGRIATLHHADYHVEWVAPNGQRVVGKPIAYTPLRVTEQDKQRAQEARRNAQVSMAGATVRVGPGGTQVGGPPAGRMSLPEITEWPDVKPAFMPGTPMAGGPIVGPDGRLWVQRHRAATDDNPRYDLIDGFGNVVGQAVLPARTRLVGFGRGTAYLVRTDEDDLQYLQRHRLF